MLQPYFSKYPTLSNTSLEVENNQSKKALKQAIVILENIIIDLQDEQQVTNDVKALTPLVVVSKQDDEDDRFQEPFVPFCKIVFYEHQLGSFL